jgi:hypothetical protein
MIDKVMPERALVHRSILDKDVLGIIDCPKMGPVVPAEYQAIGSVRD